ncbi:hypothetical protein WME79_14320 [Sorangium sp. So ce726]|uniref:hypothetical protein n=1 Tax=Sorangium sp. So ce726 TaxID=3133319 RepID=UPI003F5E23B3
MRLPIASLFGLLAALLAPPVFAGPGDKEANQGMNAARGGFCKRAIPLLESAESQRHRPSSAVPLADCYVKQGELLKASEIYHKVASEKKAPGYNGRDVAAITSAKKKAAQLDARIPTLVVTSAEPYEGLVVEIDGEVISEPSAPHRFDPGKVLVIVARAEGHEEATQKITLKEKQRREIKLRLKPKPGAKKPPEKPVAKKPPEKPVAEKPPEKPVAKKPPEKPVAKKPPGKKPPEKPVAKKPPGKKPPEKPVAKKPPEKKPPRAAEKPAEDTPRVATGADERPKPAVEMPEPTPPSPRRQRDVWLGAGFQGFFIPQLMFELLGEGGRDVLVPGGDISLSTRLGRRFDLVFSVAYARFRMQETPFKPKGHPDTDYEIVESDLQALQAGVRLVWNIPLDRDELFAFRVGAGLGVGWTFMGDLYRTQAYPGDAVPGDPGSFVPGDPYRYVKCRGPNNPIGSFRYCNQLDYDADHYPGYVEPSWFTRPKGRPQGLRPLVYPWLVLPEIGLALRPWDRVAFDLRVGASVTGVLGGLGIRFAL